MVEIDWNLIDTWALLNQIFVADTPISRSQYYDIVKSNKMHIPEVRLWIDVFCQVITDWLEYVRNPIPENYKLVKDVDEWAFRDSLALSLIADSIFLTLQIDPEIMKSKFRDWIRHNRPPSKEIVVIEAVPTFVLEEPLISVELIYELNWCPETSS